MTTAVDDLLGLRVQLVGTAPESWILSDEYGKVLDRGSQRHCLQGRLQQLKTRHGCGHPNLCAQTISGRQFWSDVIAHAGWRIQRNVFTHHHRLLDHRGRRRAWGTLPACLTALEEQRLNHDLCWKGRHLVLLVHGILRSQGSMKRLARSLQSHGLTTFALTYPSTRLSIDKAGEHLASLIAHLRGVDSIDIVTHSMGALVTRHALHQHGAKRLPTIRRLCFLAPPSMGSVLAEGMHDWWLYQWLTGPAGQDLRPQTAQHIPLPEHPTLIITGNRGFGLGRLRGLGRDSDGTVTVEEAQLPGATMAILPVGHTFVMDQPAVQELVSDWLLNPEKTP